MSNQLGTAVPFGLARQVMASVLVTKLVAFVLGLVASRPQDVSALAIACIVLSALAAGMCLWSTNILSFVVQHPITVLVDLLLVVGLIAAVGLQSSLVLAAYPTAFLVGLLTQRRVTVPLAVILIAGYIFALANTDLSTIAPAMAISIPAVFIFLIALGSVIRTFQMRYAKSNLELVKAREESVASEERARLAREMHDSLAKTLYGVAMAAKSLEPTLKKDPNKAEQTATLIAGGAEQAVRESRLVLQRLRADDPQISFLDSLKRMCEEWRENHDLDLACDLGQLSISLPVEYRYEILAIMREALDNVARHSKAEQVIVRVTEGNENVVFEVIDDGVGFSFNEVSKNRYGVVGMQERAQRIGAELEIHSQPEYGTNVEVVLTRDGVANVSS